MLLWKSSQVFFRRILRFMLITKLVETASLRSRFLQLGLFYSRDETAVCVEWFGDQTEVCESSCRGFFSTGRGLDTVQGGWLTSRIDKLRWIKPFWGYIFYYWGSVAIFHWDSVYSPLLCIMWSLGLIRRLQHFSMTFFGLARHTCLFFYSWDYDVVVIGKLLHCHSRKIDLRVKRHKSR